MKTAGRFALVGGGGMGYNRENAEIDDVVEVGMVKKPVPCAWETHAGTGAGGTLLLGSFSANAGALRQDYAGQVRCLYMDPPFFTGQRFSLRMRVGETGWRSEGSFLELPAYQDQWPDEAAYLSMMREALTLVHDLLANDGTFFLHIDYRMHGFLRVLADEIFGSDHLMNEIIWVYQSGGRAMRHFSRKHDVILFYRKGARPYFDIASVAVPRAENRSNHMRKRVDETGRAYRSIRSGGKEYRYYEDDLVYLSDVWTDISHLQQKDPERTGYDTQKPLKLLERILRCASRPEDLVMDLCFGSGTTLVAAAGLGRRFVGVDVGRSAHAVARKRLLPFSVRQQLEPPRQDTRAEFSLMPMIGFYQVDLLGYTLPEQDFPALDGVDQWSVGLLHGDTFTAYAHAARTRETPVLAAALEIPMLSGTPAALVADVYGRRQVFTL